MTGTDRARVTELLGRSPDGAFDVVVRTTDGDPVVIRNAPLLPDGRPMPTRYWLVGAEATHAVSRLEAAGGVRLAEAAVDPDELAAAHATYAAERDAALDSVLTGSGIPVEHRPSGGVAGTRRGVKCLHAHYAWHLAGGDDPVGRWVAEQLAMLVVDITPGATTVHHHGRTHRLAADPRRVWAELDGTDPPAAAALTNAVGLAIDELDDLVRRVPTLLDAGDRAAGKRDAGNLVVSGDAAWQLAVVEHGADIGGGVHHVGRADLESLFRALATEPRADRAFNPGLHPERVDEVLACCCVVIGVMRRLERTAVTFVAETPVGAR